MDNYTYLVNNQYVIGTSYQNMNELYHHGIKGQKWGIRRWQNPDGSLTDEGYRHYGYGKGALKREPDSLTKPRRLGTGIGAGVGAALGTGVAAGLTAATGGAAAPLAAFYGAYITGFGALLGRSIGSVRGVKDTMAGKNYIERYSSELAEFEKRDLGLKKAPVHDTGTKVHLI